MGAVLSSAAIDWVLKGTRNYARRWLIAQDPAGPYWSSLPEDLLLIVMAALDVPNLLRSGAVCTSWRDACNTFHLPALKQSPCLLYACDEYGPSHVALYCPSIDATFCVPFPGPPHEKRGFVFSSHGWVFAADEVGNPYLFNPMTGVQATLPPVNTLMDREEEFYDDEGKHVIEAKDDDGVLRRGFTWARHAEYSRVAISPAAEVTECTVVIVHGTDYRLSFARPGDKRWTLLPDDICTAGISDVLYNDKDGLFYILHRRGSICALDLSGPSPSVATVMGDVVRWSFAAMYLALMPSGELLHVWRMRDFIDNPLKNRRTCQDVRRVALHDCIEFANEDNNYKLSNNLQGDDVEEDDNQVSTTELVVFKVDIDSQKLVELRDIGNYAIFLGSNSAVCLPLPTNKDFPLLEPNCAYLTDDYSKESYDYTYRPMLRKDLCIGNIKKRTMQNLVDAWPKLHSWLDLPAPVWITPRF